MPATISARRRSTAGVFAGLALSLCWVCADEQSDAAPYTYPTNQGQYQSIELRTHELINQHRLSLGLDSLRWSACIATYAREHSVNMAAGDVAFGHDGFAERVSAVAAHCTTHNASAENVARALGGSDPAQTAVTIWLNSSGHKANIEGGYTHAGIGVARRSDSTWYYTQFFIHAR
jgi:uncharacterized protein YkwD